MKLISINEVEECMILAKNVHDNFGKVLLTKETVLTNNYIDRLKNFGITSVYVIDGLTCDITQETASGDTKPEPIKLTNVILTTLSGEEWDGIRFGRDYH